jgi:hypothetical protein
MNKTHNGWYNLSVQIINATRSNLYEIFGDYTGIVLVCQNGFVIETMIHYSAGFDGIP